MMYPSVRQHVMSGYRVETAFQFMLSSLCEKSPFPNNLSLVFILIFLTLSVMLTISNTKQDFHISMTL